MKITQRGLDVAEGPRDRAGREASGAGVLTMGRKSSLRRLPPEILQEVNRLLSEGRATLAEILEHLRGMGVETVSLSALGRQKQRIDKVAAKLRQSREMTEALVREIGPSVVEGQQGRLLVQTLRDLVFDHLATRVEEGDVDDPKALMALARTLKDMAQANRLDQDFEAKVRERVEKEVKAKLDKAVDEVTGDPENTALTPEELRAKLLEAYGGA